MGRPRGGVILATRIEPEVITGEASVATAGTAVATVAAEEAAEAEETAEGEEAKASRRARRMRRATVSSSCEGMAISCVTISATRASGLPKPQTSFPLPVPAETLRDGHKSAFSQVRW